MVTRQDNQPDTAPIAPVDSDATARLVGMAMIIISSIGISFGGLISRHIENADAWQINIYRSLSTSVIVAVVLAFRYRRGVSREVMKIGLPGLFGACLLAVAGVSFMQALTTTTVANTLFTLCAIPFVTASLAWMFLSETLSKVTLVTMAFAAVGIAVMLSEGIGGGTFYGNFMALITAVGFSGYAVIIRRYRNIDMLPALLLSAIILCVVALIVSIGDWDITWWDLWMCFIWGGILSGIGNILFILSSRHLLAAEVTLFMLLEFSLGPIWVWIFVNEVPSNWTLLGGALIMAAVLARTLYQVRLSRSTLRRGRLPGPV